MKEPDLRGRREPAGGTPKLKGALRQAFTGKKKMTNYVSFFLEAGVAKRRLAQLFEAETLGRPNHLSKEFVASDSSRAARTGAPTLETHAPLILPLNEITDA